MQSSLSNDSATIGKDSSYFLCTSGAELELIRHYDRHLKKVHSIKDTIISLENQAAKQELESESMEKTQKPSKMLNYEVPNIKDQAEDSIPITNPRLCSNEQWKTTLQSLLRGKLIRKNYEFRRQILFWEGFKLIKNPYCQYEPYYCGKCLALYFLIEDYIVHCLQSCQTLIHEDSSHIITLKQEKEASEDLSDNDPHDCLKQQGNIFQPACSQHIDYQPFREIISNGLDHRKYPFFCGQCQTIFPIFTYFKHFRQSHDQNIGQSSSHVIIRCRIGLFKKFVYISPRVRWPNLEKKYYCVCNPTKKLRMRQLVQHIKEYHRGVSPFYSIPTRTSIKKYQPLLKKQKMTQQDSISALYRTNRAMIAKLQLNCIKKEQ